MASSSSSTNQIRQVAQLLEKFPVAEQERNKTLARQREGLDAMRIVDGKHFSDKKQRFCGRAPVVIEGFAELLARQRRGEISVEDCCKALGISRSTWYNKVKECA